jgi:hypothetical protein
MYLPSVIDGSTLEALTASLRAELTRLAQQLGQPVEYQALKTLYAAPGRIFEGMLVKADGTTWNPGSGAGIYARVGGAWVKL